MAELITGGNVPLITCPACKGEPLALNCPVCDGLGWMEEGYESSDRDSSRAAPAERKATA